ncbi:MAG: NfeD family protein [Lachnospiraceae bacterium]|nr:NfeD family protein [Lachnospiraceae bacterium]
MDYYGILWLVALIVLLIVEFLTMGLTTIWFAGGALIALIAALCGAPLWLQIVLFIVVSIVLLLVTRPIAMKYWNKDRIKTNAESLIGQTALVTEEIDNLKAKGVVTVNGNEWTARSADNRLISKDAVVIIKEIQGVKLLVEEKI